MICTERIQLTIRKQLIKRKQDIIPKNKIHNKGRGK